MRQILLLIGIFTIAYAPIIFLVYRNYANKRVHRLSYVALSTILAGVLLFNQTTIIEGFLRILVYLTFLISVFLFLGILAWQDQKYD